MFSIFYGNFKILKKGLGAFAPTKTSHWIW